MGRVGPALSGGLVHGNLGGRAPPRWLLVLGMGVALWYLKLGMRFSNEISFVLISLGLLTIGGCLIHLARALLSKHRLR